MWSLFPQCATEEGLVETIAVSDQGLILREGGRGAHGEDGTACNLTEEYGFSFGPF